MAINPELRMELLRTMVRIRAFEEKAGVMFLRGRTAHFQPGQV